MSKARIPDDEAAVDRAQFLDLLYELRLTHARAARLLGLNQHTISKYARGLHQVPPAIVLALYALRAHFNGVQLLPTTKRSARPPTRTREREPASA